MNEIWIPVKEYEGLYEISNFGGVRTLSKKGKVERISVHRLVAIHFIENPLKKAQVNHIDHDKTNNYVDHLEWVTKEEAEKVIELRKLKDEGWPNKELSLRFGINYDRSSSF
ncbi:NUMOD4 domain-containing protein [Shimazuella kribbensis]|uniref:NUMOD4 domain-containing protein n=1 Tax=Shimazuella kribbensis TaxID=139808 RepID=UPI00041BE2A5|nr:NUMOD4 domain-containing protein [Shimazuella kribbensis]